MTKTGRIYNKLASFGYELILKPVKIFKQPGGKQVRKANCDVDLTFYSMRDRDSFKRVIFLSGDGDLKYY